MADLSRTKPGRSKALANKGFLVFSIILYVIISAITYTGYFIAARQINHAHVEYQLIIASEAINARLTSELSSDLILLLNLRASTVIHDYFRDPWNPALRELAYVEFRTFQQESTEGSLFWASNNNRVINSFGLPPAAIASGSPEAVWFTQVLRETADHNFYISLDRLTGRVNLLVSVPVFPTYDISQIPVGVLGIEFDMAEITRIITSVHREIHEHIACYLFNQASEITSSVDTGLIAGKVPLAAHLGAPGTEAIRIADMITGYESHNFILGNYMYRVGTIPVIPGWNIILRYPLPGMMALNVQMNIVFMSMQAIIFILFIIMNIFVARSSRAMAKAHSELAQEKDVIQAMKDNIDYGIFLIDTELKILPQYSEPLLGILSYYDSNLEGKNLLDILAVSLDSTQLQGMRDFFEMMFSKTARATVLERANPISEFEYKTETQVKTLTTKFRLIERADSEPVVIGVLQDITKEKEFEKELQAQKESQQLEMKNIFDVLQIDPLVLKDFIEETESNFHYINSILKDRSLTAKQALTKLFQNVHAMKSNALILGLEAFGKKLHVLEDGIKIVLSAAKVSEDDVLRLVVELETIMQEKDSYKKIVTKIEKFKSANRIDSVILYSLRKAVENIAGETKKNVELKAVQMDAGILETNLRKPIKDILFQCIRNSIYHGIEIPEERVKKGKSPQGLLTISLKKTDNNAELIFSDDGRGLDWNELKARYLKRCPEAKNIDKKTLLSFVFSPGVSTAGKTSSLAGRGVGLSLVKDIIKENGGTIKAESSESGLSLKFVLPLPD